MLKLFRTILSLFFLAVFISHPSLTYALESGVQIPSGGAVQRLQASAYKDVNWVKFQYPWDQASTTPIDSWVQSARSAGYKVLVSVAKKPANIPDDASGYAQFGAFMEQTARKLGNNVEAYEIWNEPNLKGEWAGFGEPDPIKYIQVLREGSAGVKRGNPNAKVISAALAPLTWEYDDEQFFNEFVAGGGLQYVDGVGWHSNVNENIPPNDPSMRGFQRVKIGLRGGKPVWITEFGWARDLAGIDRATHERYIKEAYQLAPTLGDIPVMILWNFGFGKENIDPSFLQWDVEDPNAPAVAANSCPNRRGCFYSEPQSDGTFKCFMALCQAGKEAECDYNKFCIYSPTCSETQKTVAGKTAKVTQEVKCPNLSLGEKGVEPLDPTLLKQPAASTGNQIPTVQIGVFSPDQIAKLKQTSSLALKQFKDYEAQLVALQAKTTSQKTKDTITKALAQLKTGTDKANKCSKL